MLMPSINKLSELTEFLTYVLYSDYIKLDEEAKEVSISAMIIAKIESGKTAIINQFNPNNGMLVMSDITEWGLLHNYLDKLKDGSVKRILIPDLINPVNRKQETVNTLITFFNSYISWEGVNSISTFAINIPLEYPLKGSLLTTIAIADFNRLVEKLAAVGFLSRLVPITYAYAQNTVEDILLDIADNKDKWTPIRLNLPEDRIEINLEPELAKKLIPLAKHIGEQAGAYGFRAMKQLMILIKCRALVSNRTKVNVEDIERIEHLAKRFIKYPDEARVL